MYRFIPIQIYELNQRFFQRTLQTTILPRMSGWSSEKGRRRRDKTFQ
jgi:hypothetical protein